MQYCLSAKLTATAKSLSLARVYCNFVVVPHEITVRESLRIQSYKQKILLSEPRKNFSLQRDMLIATHPLPPRYARHLPQGAGKKTEINGIPWFPLGGTVAPATKGGLSSEHNPYLPIQNLSNISLIISSCTVSPVISPNRSIAERTSITMQS